MSTDQRAGLMKECSILQKSGAELEDKDFEIEKQGASKKKHKPDADKQWFAHNLNKYVGFIVASEAKE